MRDSWCLVASTHNAEFDMRTIYVPTCLPATSLNSCRLIQNKLWNICCILLSDPPSCIIPYLWHSQQDYQCQQPVCRLHSRQRLCETTSCLVLVSRQTLKACLLKAPQPPSPAVHKQLAVSVFAKTALGGEHSMPLLVMTCTTP